MSALFWKIVLISDGNLGTQQGMLSKSLASLQHGHGPSELPLPFPFPAKLNIVCIASPDDEALKVSEYVYNYDYIAKILIKFKVTLSTVFLSNLSNVTCENFRIFSNVLII